MRIAWFTHRYHPVISGAENFGRAIVSRFVADGHHADVFTSDADDLRYFTSRKARKVDSPAESLVDGAHVRRFPVLHRVGQKYAGRLLSYLPHWPSQCRYESFMPLIPGIDRVGGAYDAVFAVGFPYTIFSHAAWATSRRAGAPLILAPFLHLSTPGDPVNRLYNRPHQAKLLQAANLVIVPTSVEASAVVDRGVDRSRILVLGMGVDHDGVTGGDPRTLRDRLRIAGHHHVIGHLATLSTNKGTTDLVKAAMALNRDPGQSPVHLILAGTSTPEFEAFAASLPALSSRWLHRIGPLPDNGRPDFYAALNVFAMPSRTDSYGIVFLEAWANALPVVAASAGAVVEVVDDGRDGLLVPFGDVAGLTRSLGRLRDEPNLGPQLGACGKKKVAHGYTWNDRYQTLRDRVRNLPQSQHRPTAKTGSGTVFKRSATSQVPSDLVGKRT